MCRVNSKIIAHLLEKKIKRGDKTLFECAVAVERDTALQCEMEDWNTTMQDGLKHP